MVSRGRIARLIETAWRSCLRLELLGQALEQRARSAASHEVQEGPVKQKAECPEWWRVATVEDDIVRRDPELASEDRKQWSEGRRLPCDLDEDVVADQPRRGRCR